MGILKCTYHDRCYNRVNMKVFYLHLLFVGTLALALLVPVVSFAQSFDVSLESQNRTYNASRIPIHPAGYDAFSSTEWIPGGHFVSTGNCNNVIGAIPGSRDREGTLESAGQYVFNENGTINSVSNACLNTASVTVTGCNEGGGCSIGRKVFPISDSLFIREGNPFFGHWRSPVSYRVLGSLSTALVGRNFFNDWFGPESGDPNIGQMVSVLRDSAFANGIYVVNGLSYEGGNQSTAAFYKRTFFLSTPDMIEVARLSNPLPPCSVGCSGNPPPNASVPFIFPEIGLGEYIIGRDEGDIVGGFRPVYAYKIPSEGALAAGALPENIGRLDFIGLMLHAERDVGNNNQVVLYVRTQSVANPNGDTLLITYKATGSGVEEVSRRVSPFQLLGGAVQKFSVSGNILAWTECDRVPHDFAGQGPLKCDLVVEEAGELLSVESLPLDSEGNFQSVNTFAISPSGKILVTAKTLGRTNGNTTSTTLSRDQENVYTYQVGGLGSPGDPSGLGGPGIPQPEQPDIGTYQSIVRSYINILSDLLGGLGVGGSRSESGSGMFQNFNEFSSTAPSTGTEKSIFDGIPGVSDNLRRLFPDFGGLSPTAPRASPR